jgi:L-threonylcarbamoyladenylate synthase
VLWPSEPRNQARLLAEAVLALNTGSVVGVPTDTVYGLAAHPEHDGAMETLYALKDRPREKAIALLVAEPEDLERLAAEVPDAARALAEQYWPGGLTLVLRSAADPSITLALRMPDHEVPLSLIRQIGSPLATTSANRSAATSPRTADDVLAQLPGGYPLLIDDGPCPIGVDSTVVDVTRSPARLLRRGAIGQEMIKAVVGELDDRG